MFFSCNPLPVPEYWHSLPTSVEDSSAYLTERKYEVYRDAVEGALVDDRITETERDILAKLQESLEIDAASALRIEREVQSELRGAPGLQAVAAM